jgi:hypothetical protein
MGIGAYFNFLSDRASKPGRKKNDEIPLGFFSTPPLFPGFPNRTGPDIFCL